MRTSPLGTLCLIACLCVSGCSNRRGPATEAYLRSSQNGFREELAKLTALPAIPAPARPLPPRSGALWQERAQFRRAVRDYPANLIAWDGRAIERMAVIQGGLGRAQARLAALDPRGADPEAVAFVSSTINFVGESRVAFSMGSDFIRLHREILERRRSGADLVAFMTDTAVALVSSENPYFAVLKGSVDAIAKAKKEDTSVAERAENVREEFERVHEQLVRGETMRAQLQLTLRRRYPNQDWSFLDKPTVQVSAK